jgi:hypothetical protein
MFSMETNTCYYYYSRCPYYFYMSEFSSIKLIVKHMVDFNLLLFSEAFIK